MQLRQFRLVLEQLKLRRRPRHVQINNSLGFRLEHWRFGRERVGALRQNDVASEQGLQRHCAEPETSRLEEMATCDGAGVLKLLVHIVSAPLFRHLLFRNSSRFRIALAVTIHAAKVGLLTPFGSVARADLSSASAFSGAASNAVRASFCKAMRGAVSPLRGGRISASLIPRAAREVVVSASSIIRRASPAAASR